jgi:membrane-bound metal-dependent hydrolase YbcI (DUF457 family)
MPLAVTHLLSGVFLVEIWKNISIKVKSNFSPYLVLFAAFFSAIPDIDFFFVAMNHLFDFIFPSWLYHGGVTHTPFFSMLFLIPGIILWKLKKDKLAVYFCVAGVGILIHVILDYIIGGGSMYGVMWLFPFSSDQWLIHLLEPYRLFYSFELLDGFLLFFWLWYEKFIKRNK